MLRGCRLLVFAVVISQCLLRPYVSSFRIWRSTVNTNSGYCQISRLSSSEDDIKALYEKAQIEDAEWLQRVLGTTPLLSPALDLNDGNRLNSAKSNIGEDRLANPPQQLTAAPIDSVTSEALSLLGYSIPDILSMKDTVISVILESSVKRPRKGLPQSWIKIAPESDISASESSTESTLKADARLSPPDYDIDERRESIRQSVDRTNGYLQNKEPEKRQRARPAEGESSQYERKSSKKISDVGEAFAWKGSPPTSDELENSQRLRREFRENESQNAYSNSGPQTKSKNFAKSDWDDDKDEDSPSPFWPDVDEFKDMLLDESQWRSGIIGTWSVPFIREETKWRYKLYKNWLKFLDEGLGDGFDVVADGFDEHYDGDDDSDDFNRRYNDVNDDGARSPTSSNFRESTDEYRDRPASRPSRDANTSELSKAEKYDAWVKQRVGATGVWTDLEEEEWEATRDRREAAERRRREEAYNDYKYEGRRKRSTQQTEEELRRRVDFEVDETDNEPVNGYKTTEAFKAAWKASAERAPSPDYYSDADPRD